jgi:putative intracellular protease/amidase
MGRAKKGFWASELTHAYHAFAKQGYEVVVASPDGGTVEMDGLSDPRDASGYSMDDALSLRYLAKPEFMALLEKTPSVRELRGADFDAIVVACGQSPMFTFQGAAGLRGLFTEFHRAGKVSAALCHGDPHLPGPRRRLDHRLPCERGRGAWSPRRPDHRRAPLLRPGAVPG